MIGSSPWRWAAPRTMLVPVGLVWAMTAARRGSHEYTEAACTTAWQPSIACWTVAGLVTSPTTASTSVMPNGPRAGAIRWRLRTNSRTWWPSASSAATVWQPTNPVPPVTSTRIVAPFGGERAAGVHRSGRDSGGRGLGGRRDGIRLGAGEGLGQRGQPVVVDAADLEVLDRAGGAV